MEIKITVEPEEIADIVAATTKSAKNISDNQKERILNVLKSAVIQSFPKASCDNAEDSPA